MSAALPILASSDTAIVKLAGFVIVLIIWGMWALASSVKNVKKQGATRLPPLASAAPRPRPQAGVLPPRLATAISSQAPLPPLSARSQVSSAKRPAAKASPRPPVLPNPRPPAAPVTTRPVPPTARATAAPIARWFGRSTIRSQFVLSEILGKPVALKDRPRI